jgi:hypothetical protein
MVLFFYALNQAPEFSTDLPCFAHLFHIFQRKLVDKWVADPFRLNYTFCRHRPFFVLATSGYFFVLFLSDYQRRSHHACLNFIRSISPEKYLAPSPNRDTWNAHRTTTRATCITHQDSSAECEYNDADGHSSCRESGEGTIIALATTPRAGWQVVLQEES